MLLAALMASALLSVAPEAEPRRVVVEIPPGANGTVQLTWETHSGFTRLRVEDDVQSRAALPDTDPPSDDCRGSFQSGDEVRVWFCHPVSDRSSDVAAAAIEDTMENMHRILKAMEAEPGREYFGPTRVRAR